MLMKSNRNMPESVCFYCQSFVSMFFFFRQLEKEFFYPINPEHSMRKMKDQPNQNSIAKWSPNLWFEESPDFGSLTSIWVKPRYIDFYSERCQENVAKTLAKGLCYLKTRKKLFQSDFLEIFEQSFYLFPSKKGESDYHEKEKRARKSVDYKCNSFDFV